MYPQENVPADAPLPTNAGRASAGAASSLISGFGWGTKNNRGNEGGYVDSPAQELKLLDIVGGNDSLIL